MPSNEDLKHQSEVATNSRASGDTTVGSVFPDYHEAVDNGTTANEAGNNETSAVPFSSDHSMMNEFTFYQKNKRAVQSEMAPSLAYASTSQVTAFAARLDSAAAASAKTQRHIAELMTLMSGVALNMPADASMPTCKRLRRSKWLFYGCLVGFGVGWFFLFPFGHNFITQLMVFWVR